jgi:hypothetical protein
MRRAVIALVVLLGSTVALAAAHMAFIEIGRDVVTLRTHQADGSWQETRLWVVDDGTSLWLHSGGAAWKARFHDSPRVELQRRGQMHTYCARPVPGPHPRVDQLLREKYGLADRWVRFISPDNAATLAVRLDDCDG